MASESASKPEAARSLWESEVIVTDLIGRLIEFWGFKRNMGRVWAVLYLSHEPLTAQELRDLLRLSSGAVSMILSELSRWGVVRKVWIQGDRRDHFAAEVQLWRGQIHGFLLLQGVLDAADRALATAALALRRAWVQPS